MAATAAAAECELGENFPPSSPNPPANAPDDHNPFADVSGAHTTTAETITTGTRPNNPHLGIVQAVRRSIWAAELLDDPAIADDWARAVEMTLEQRRAVQDTWTPDQRDAQIMRWCADREVTPALGQMLREGFAQ